MKCICILKSDHECSETFDSYEKQYEENDAKITIDPTPGPFLGFNSPLQAKIRADIDSVKLLFPFLHDLDEEDIAHFSTIVAHYPQEFSEIEKKVMYIATTNMMRKSKKYFCQNGRMKQRLL